jgi:hypothetical protein
MTCHACGAQLSATARFCHKCGAAITTTPATRWRAGLPWALAGAAFGALVAVIAMRATGPRSPETAGAGPGDGTAGGGAPAIDISQMSPEERANRLFNRVMILAEAGKQDSVQFFMPMALATYSQLPTLDADARYHIGLLQLAAGDIPAALAQADSIGRAIPTHLFIYVLRAHAYQQRGNTPQERRAYTDFLKNEPGEMAKNRPEYADHRDALTSFKAEAARVTSRPPPAS